MSPNSLRRLRTEPCPTCRREAAVANSLATRFPDVAAQADGWDPTAVAWSSKAVLTWRCPDAASGHPVFERQVYKFTVAGAQGRPGAWCPLCSNRRRPTLEAFVAAARSVHGDAYSYSNAVYVDSHTPIAVTCRKHGDFRPTPANHTHNKSGCPRCAPNRQLSVVNFVEQATSRHGDTYDYSEVTVARGSGRAEGIRCRLHGLFTQAVSDHLSKGAGCNECGRQRTADARRTPVTAWKQRSTAVHNGKYCYDLVPDPLPERVSIVCPDHGAFEQLATTHVNGAGCRRCSGIEKLTQVEFVEACRAKHGDTYEYERAIYVGNKKPVLVTCRTHGDFEVTPNHLRLRKRLLDPHERKRESRNANT